MPIFLVISGTGLTVMRIDDGIERYNRHRIENSSRFPVQQVRRKFIFVVLNFFNIKKNFIQK